MNYLQKCAEISYRNRAYLACRAILRTKYGYYIPRENYMEKQALIPQLIGGGLGAWGGYTVGDNIAKYYGWADDSWKARLARWGGGALGGVVGALAPGLGSKAIGWGARALGFGGRAATAARGAAAAANVAKGATTAANAAAGGGMKGMLMNSAAMTGMNMAGNALMGGGAQPMPQQPMPQQQPVQQPQFNPSGLPTYMNQYSQNNGSGGAQYNA